MPICIRRDLQNFRSVNADRARQINALSTRVLVYVHFIDNFRRIMKCCSDKLRSTTTMCGNGAASSSLEQRTGSSITMKNQSCAAGAAEPFGKYLQITLD